LSIEPHDFDYSPFTPRGDLGKVQESVGDQLPRLFDELNERLAA
jgi:type I restriction enzyme R subunit